MAHPYHKISTASMKDRNGSMKLCSIQCKMAAENRHGNGACGGAPHAVGEGDDETLITLHGDFFDLLVQKHAN